MKKVDDISGLYKHIGTTPEQYKEIGLENEARESEARWPLLGQIHARIRTSHAIETPEPSHRRIVQPDSLMSEPVVVRENVNVFTNFMPEPAAPEGLDADEFLGRTDSSTQKRAEFIPPNPIALAAFGAGDRMAAHYSRAELDDGARHIAPIDDSPAATDGSGTDTNPAHGTEHYAPSSVEPEAAKTPTVEPTTQSGQRSLNAVFAQIANTKPSGEAPNTEASPKKKSLFDRLVRS